QQLQASFGDLGVLVDPAAGPAGFVGAEVRGTHGALRGGWGVGTRRATDLPLPGAPVALLLPRRWSAMRVTYGPHRADRIRPLRRPWRPGPLPRRHHHPRSGTPRGARGGQ